MPILLFHVQTIRASEPSEMPKNLNPADGTFASKALCPSPWRSFSHSKAKPNIFMAFAQSFRAAQILSENKFKFILFDGRPFYLVGATEAHVFLAHISYKSIIDPKANQRISVPPKDCFDHGPEVKWRTAKGHQTL